MVRGGAAENVLVIGVERLSDFTDPTTAAPRSSSATAPARPWSAVRDPGIGPTIWGSDGEKWDAISQTDSWIDVREKGLSWPHIGMQGQTVFRWAVWGMAPVAQQALDAAGVTVDQLDAFIPHQANMRIVDAMAKQLKMPDRRGRSPATSLHRQHVGGVDPARDGADAAQRRGAPRRPRPADRLRRRAGLRRAGRRPPLTHDSRGPTGHRATHTSHPRKRTKEHRMAQSEQEILAGLAEIVNEETGLDTAEVAVGQVVHRRPRHRLAVDDDDRRQRRGEVRRHASPTTRSRTSRPSATPSSFIAKSQA